MYHSHLNKNSHSNVDVVVRQYIDRPRIIILVMLSGEWTGMQSGQGQDGPNVFLALSLPDCGA